MDPICSIRWPYIYVRFPQRQNKYMYKYINWSLIYVGIFTWFSSCTFKHDKNKFWIYRTIVKLEFICWHWKIKYLFLYHLSYGRRLFIWPRAVSIKQIVVGKETFCNFCQIDFLLKYDSWIQLTINVSWFNHNVINNTVQLGKFLWDVKPQTHKQILPKSQPIYRKYCITDIDDM